MEEQAPAPAQVNQPVYIPTDSAVATLTTVEGEPTRKAYTVKAQAGLFKNGKLYSQGDEVQLDEQTANAFLALDEVELKQ